MPSYSVFAPGTGIDLVASVDAPNTKQARTVYLDYLSRNGKISWNDRQAMRSYLKVVKDSEGTMEADVHLDYDMNEEDVGQYGLEDYREPIDEEYGEQDDYERPYTGIDPGEEIEPDYAQFVDTGGPSKAEEWNDRYPDRARYAASEPLLQIGR